MKKLKNKILGMICMLAVSMTVFMGNAVAAEDLTLNPEVLKRAKEETYATSAIGNCISIMGAELFYGINENGCTLTDILNSLEKYGYQCRPGNTKDNEGILMYNLYLGTGEWCTEDLLNDTEIFRDTFSQMQRDVVIYPDTEFDVCFFDVLYYEANEPPISLAETQAFIDKIEFVNRANNTTPHVQKDGWFFEDGAWRYYENNISITNSWKDIEGKRYYFKDDGSMVHSGLQEIEGNIYSFSTDGPINFGWQINDPGDGEHWYYFEYDPDFIGAARLGYQNGIHGDPYKYFFWTNGYTDQNGNSHAKGSLAIGNDSLDQWIFKNGAPVYVADKDGHLYVNTEMELNGIAYVIDNDGNVSLKNTHLKPYGHSDKNYNGKPYSDYLVVAGFDPGYVTEQTLKGDNGNCTATCDFLIGKITGRLNGDALYSNEESKLWGNNGAKWIYTRSIDGGSQQWDTARKLRETYMRIEQGTPVVLRCSNHSVTAIGIRKGTNVSSFDQADILVVDPSVNGGQVITLKELADVFKYVFNENGAKNWGLIIANTNTVNPKALTQ